MVIAWNDGSVVGSHWGKKDAPPSLPHIYCGWIAKDETGATLHYSATDLGESLAFSQNTAEYMSVRSSLLWLDKNGYSQKPIEIRTDSQVIVKQLQGTYQAHDPRMEAMRNEVWRITEAFVNVVWRWIPREENQEADFLSKCLQAKYGAKMPTLTGTNCAKCGHFQFKTDNGVNCPKKHG